MARLFTADLHLGHANVIRYCDRPFADVDEMDRALVAGWNAVVADDDEVWVLGDLAMGPLAHSLEVAAELQGRKHLVIGNHDRPFHGKKVDEYEAAGFELHHGTVELVLPGGVVVHACHFPYVGDSGDLDRHVEDRPIDDGGWLLHGHVHEKWRQRGRMVNVGVDAWGGRPVEDHGHRGAGRDRARRSGCRGRGANRLAGAARRCRGAGACAGGGDGAGWWWP